MLEGFLSGGWKERESNILPFHGWIVSFCCCFLCVLGRLFEFFQITFGEDLKKRLHLCVDIAYAYKHQNTSTDDSPSLLVTTQLKPSSTLPFRPLSCSCRIHTNKFIQIYTNKPCHIQSWLDTLSYRALDTQSPFPENSSSVTWKFEGDILVLMVWHCVYWTLSPPAPFGLLCQQGWKWGKG